MNVMLRTFDLYCVFLNNGHKILKCALYIMYIQNYICYEHMSYTTLQKQLSRTFWKNHL
jgi:hypothetical protein